LILTGYFDESGTHADAKVSAMAGFLGDRRQWRKFEKLVGKLFKRYKVDVFHTIDVRRTDADFVGWKVDRKLEFLDKFQHIINDTLEAGVATFITSEDYDYYKRLTWPPKARHDSKYALLFRGCMAHVIDTVGQMALGKEPRLKIVLEDGHKNANDALRIYNSIIDRLGERKALSGLSYANKIDCLPLAAADLFAYSAWGQRVGQKPIGELKKASVSDASYRQNFFRVELNRDSLNSLHEQAVKHAHENLGR
jgi:hypothetical protein